jgi:hypothetical protein
MIPRTRRWRFRESVKPSHQERATRCDEPALADAGEQTTVALNYEEGCPDKDSRMALYRPDACGSMPPRPQPPVLGAAMKSLSW